jgi:two-component system phosphate regulon sensor histidine kinase PhoR
METLPIGVLHVFNKRYGLKFTDEDVHLLTVLARNAAAIITTAKVYLSIADEKKQLEYTLRSMTSGLLVVSRARQIQLINATAARLLAIKSGEGVGRSFHEAIANDEIRDFLTQALEQEGNLAKEFQIDERFYQAQTDLVRDERGTVTGVLCVFNDVTELRNVERMKSDFVSTVSHELRTPLTAIKGFVRTLLEDPTGEYYDQTTRLEFYNIIDTECDRLIRLISDLLNVSRIERGLPLHMNYSQVDVSAVVEQCLTFHRGYTDHHELVTRIPPNLPALEADRDKLDQVLSNLISNAIKYSPDGGRITVSVTDGGTEMHFAVSDQGMGIPAEHLEKVFQRFHRVHSGDSQRVGGTGIGLFLTKSLVEAHGGAIRAESNPGRGSTFHFTIPKIPPVELVTRQ